MADLTAKTTILIGDILDQLKYIPGKSVDTIITSPPYFAQRDYKADGQIGHENSIADYVNKMVEIGNALKRVLKDTGSYFLNIGDKYNKKNLQMIPERVAIALQDNGWVLRNTIIWYKPNHMPSSFGDRLSNVWEPIYFFVKDTGKYYTQDYHVNLDAIRVPHRTTESVDSKVDFPETITTEEYEGGDWKERIDAYNKAKGYKGKFKDETINKGRSPGARKSLGVYYSKQRIHKIDGETELEIIRYLKEKRNEKKVGTKEIDNIFGYKDTAGHWFRLDPGNSLPKPGDWDKLKEILDLDDRYDAIMTEQHYVLQVVKRNKNGKNPGDLWVIPQDEEFDEAGNVWKISLERLRDDHFAAFPTSLPYKIIKAFCPKDGVVLDCFAGSGTTGRAAMMLSRKSILIDINPEYKKIMDKRCKTESVIDFGD